MWIISEEIKELKNYNPRGNTIVIFVLSSQIWHGRLLASARTNHGTCTRSTNISIFKNKSLILFGFNFRL